MKLLLFSDVHGNKRHCRQLVEMAQQVDVVVGAGDFGNLRRGIKKTIDILSAINKPSVLVPGNAESFEELREACKNWKASIVLHGSGTAITGVNFYGIGGGIPVTPFGSWSYDFTEDQAIELLRNCPKNGVLISHSPPYGILDLSSRGESLGSTSVRQTLTDKQPKLVVCGHIHESWNQQIRVENTDIVNAGPFGINYIL